MGFLAELKRRNVIRVAIAYVVGAWLVLQAAEVLSSLLELPTAIGKTVVMVLALGFIPALAFAWVYELTPDGLKKESEVSSDVTFKRGTGRKLNALIVAMLAAAAIYFFWESRLKPGAENIEPASVSDPAAAETTDLSVAVLPFVSMSSETDNEYFADGLSEEILNRLAQVPELRVIGRTSSFAFKNQNQDLREIGSMLGAANILEGSVRRQGNQVRITAQLISAADGAHLWSQNFDRRMDDVFAIQDEIAQRVVDALDIVLDDDTRRAMLQAGIRNVDAFVAHQQAYQLMMDAHGHDRMDEMLATANELWDQAIAAEPEFAEAYLQKTDRYAHQVLESHRPLEVRLAALESMQDLYARAQATARDPQRRRMIEIDRLFFSDDWSRLPGLLDEAFRSDGCASGSWMELALPFAPEVALMKHLERRMACEPMMMLTYTMLTGLHLRRNEVEEARQVMATGDRLAGDHRWLRAGKRDLDMKTGRGESLLNELRRQQLADPGQFNLLTQMYVLAYLERFDEARLALNAARGLGELSLANQIIANSILGNRQAANAAAAELDSQPGGPVELIRGPLNGCACGAVFDLEYTPNLAQRLAEAGWDWPPPTTLHFNSPDAGATKPGSNP